MNYNDILFGRNSVLEAIKAGRDIDAVYVQKGERKGSILHILSVCRDNSIVIKNCDGTKLTELCSSPNHQGIAAVIAATEYVTVAEILDSAKKKGTPPFVVVCDGIEDPHNLGSIIRTAEACGVDGVIIPKRRSASANGTVNKASAGALSYVKIAKVPNIVTAIEELKSAGVWVYAADMDGQEYCGCDISGAFALVVGSEGFGVSRLVREHCDGILSLMMNGNINSLNASVAAGILLYEATRQRMNITALNK